MKPFNLLVWAIVAVALLALTIILFQNFFPEKNIETELKSALIQAEANYEKIIKINDFSIKRNTLITKNIFENYNRSVAVECTSSTQCCPIGEKCNEIEWKNTYLKFNKPTSINFYVRCSDKEISICRIYTGLKPAEANHISLTKHVNGKQLILQQKVTNSGEVTLTEGEAKLEIEKKVGEKWLPTEKIVEEQTLKKLDSKMEHTFVWDIEIINTGEYRAKTSFYSNNSGKDISYIDFNITLSSGCVIDETREETIEYQEEGKWFREIRYCNNCDYAYECLAKWMEAYPGREWKLLDKEKVYCSKESINESCLD